MTPGYASHSPWVGPSPLAHNPRVMSRMPGAYVIGNTQEQHRATYGVDLEVYPWAVDAAAYAREGGDTARPAGASEVLRWAEDTGPVRLPAFTGELAWEVARIEQPERALCMVETVATYLRIAGDGVSFLTGQSTDPFAPQPFTDGGGNTLAVRWRLVAPSDFRPRAAGIAAYAVPAGPDVSLPVEWRDFRFAWGSRYSTNLRAIVPGGARLVRLFAIVAISGGQWTVDVGGRLSGWTMLGGSRKAALAASLRRE